MVFYFESSVSGYVVYMGKDKFENEGLIEHGWKSDLWFHVNGLSSAHVYLRVPLETAMCGCKSRCGCIMDTIPEEVVEEMCQLVKANSIAGCKLASTTVVYTPHSNLRAPIACQWRPIAAPLLLRSRPGTVSRGAVC